MHAQPPRRSHSLPLPPGFSLIELLVAVAVIGILAGIAIPSVGKINDAGKVAAAQRQAQDIASVFAAGQAAGAVSFLAADGVLEAMDAVGIGANGVETMAPVRYQIEGVHRGLNADLPAAHRPGFYLGWADGNLAYDPDGGNLH